MRQQDDQQAAQTWQAQAPFLRKRGLNVPMSPPQKYAEVLNLTLSTLLTEENRAAAKARRFRENSKLQLG